MPKGTLANIPAEKRERVLREAAMFFAERGYAQTDMAALAKRCGISKGSIYTYFDSKEELYLFVCRDALERSRREVWGAVGEDWDIYRQVEHIFRRGVEFGRAHPEFISAYLSIAAAGQEQFALQLSLEVEKQTADRLKRALGSGVAAGEVRPDIDVNQAAWFINNTYIMFLASLVSRHFQIRFREYLDLGSEPDDPVAKDRAIDQQLEMTIQQLEAFLRPSQARRPIRKARQ